MALTTFQCRMARAALGWSLHVLAGKAGLSYNTVRRFENDSNARPKTTRKCREALETGGVEFIDRGVRLKED